MTGRRTNSSRLRHRLTLQEEVRAADGAGGYTRSWQDVADVWAEILTITGTASGKSAGKEILFAAQLQSQVTHRILLRYRDGVTAGMRLLFGNRTFNILYVANSGENNDTLEVLASEGTAA